MDISQWLNDTAAAGRPKKPTPIARSPTSLHPSKVEVYSAVRPPKRRLPMRRRSGGSSSILAPANSPSDRSARQPKRARRDDVLPIASGTRSNQSMTSTAGSASDAQSTEHYRRRKRHKTRADKYDVKPKRTRNAKEHAGHRGRGDKRKDKKRSKEEKKVIKGKTAAAVVQNFNAPNVLTERLTHAPNSGLFKRGRASSAFRGRGIPDLVFSEMSFLQNRKGLHDAGNPVEGARTGRSMDKLRQSEEEISAYFVPTRPPLQEKDSNRPSKERLPPKDSKKRSPTDPHRRQIPEASLIRHSIEPCAVTARSASATSFTWSTSVVLGAHHETDRPAAQLRRSSTHNHSHTSAQGSVVASHDPRSLLRYEVDPEPRRSDGNGVPVVQDAVGRRYRDDTPQQVKAKDYQPRKHQEHRITNAIIQRSRTEPQQPAQESTESLPMPSSPPKVTRKRSTPIVPLDSVREDFAMHISAPRSEPADQIPPLSIPLDELLQDCEAAILAHSSEGLLNAVDDVEPVPHFDDDEEECSASRAERLSLREDVRRAWRSRQDEESGRFQLRRQAYVPPADHIAGQQFFPQNDLGEEEPLQMDEQCTAQQLSEHDVDVDDEEIFHFAGNIWKNLMTTEGLHEEDSCGVEPAEEDDFDGFWRPNVLY